MFENIKKLRELTGLSILECRKALVQANNNFDKALEILKSLGGHIVSKKQARVASQGIVASYIHTGNKIGAMIELRCETDFVARNEEFKKLGYDLAMQVAAMSPVYIKEEELPKQTEFNPEEVCFYLQPYIKDQNQNIKEFINSYVAKFGEKIEVTKFVRFEI